MERTPSEKQQEGWSSTVAGPALDGPDPTQAPFGHALRVPLAYAPPR